jgi:hypothetical protein
MGMALASAVRNAEIDGAELVLARARNQQCFVWRFLGEQQKAINACREAQRIYSAAGDRGGEADTLRLLADAISDSDVPRAMLFYLQSLAVQREIGHLSGQAIVLNELAIQYSTGGNHAADVDCTISCSVDSARRPLNLSDGKNGLELCDHSSVGFR